MTTKTGTLAGLSSLLSKQEDITWADLKSLKPATPAPVPSASVEKIVPPPIVDVKIEPKAEPKVEVKVELKAQEPVKQPVEPTPEPTKSIEVPKVIVDEKPKEIVKLKEVIETPKEPKVEQQPPTKTDLYYLQFKRDQLQWEQTIKNIPFEFPLLEQESKLTWKQRLNRVRHYQQIEMQFWSMIQNIHKRGTHYALRNIVFIPRDDISEPWSFPIRNPVRKEAMQITETTFKSSKINTLTEKSRYEFDFLGVSHKDDKWTMVKQFLKFILPRLHSIQFRMNMRASKQLGISPVELTELWQEEIVGNLPDHRHNLVFGGAGNPFLEVEDPKAGLVFFSLYVDDWQ